jgi:ABC-2 type transport system ATP-binding protein
MIRLEGVTKRYGRFTAVHELDLEVKRGELFGFLGPNGAGKTTTIRMVTGILRPTAGAITVAGREMLKDPVGAKRHIGYIPDRPVLYDKLTGSEFLRFVSGLWGYDDEATEKLLISSALVHSPDVIVVDEPMVGLDPRAARLIKDLLRAFVDQGGTVFLTTHTLEVAEALCDRIAIMHAGRIRAMGSMQELRAQAAAGTAGLEEIFLKLTGSEDVKEVIAALRPTGTA